MYKICLDCLPELDRPPYSLGILALIAVSRARPLANAYSAVHLPPLHHASLRLYEARSNELRDSAIENADQCGDACVLCLEQKFVYL